MSSTSSLSLSGTSDTESISSRSDEFISDKESSRKKSRSHSDKKDKQKKNDGKDKQDDDQRENIVISFDWNVQDTISLLILIFLAVFSRFWIIQYPRHFVGEEEKQIQKINSYLNGSFFISSQPPLSDLFLTFIAAKKGYRQTLHPPYADSNYTFPNMEYCALRAPSALLSALVVPISFFVVRLLGGSTFASLSAGFFTLFDFLLIGNARNISTNGFIQFYIAMTVFFSALLRHFHPASTSWSICIIMQSLFAGMALSSNWSCISVVLFVILFNYLTYHTFRPIPVNIVISALIFFFSFFAHAIFTPYKSINSGVISSGYRKDLIDHGKPFRIKHHKIPFRTVELIFICLKMHRQQSKFVALHKWIFMTCKWDVLWKEGGRSVAVFGNTPVWWGIGIATICEITKLVLSRRIRENTAIIFCGYVCCLIYLMFGTSENGLRDYQTSLMFGILGLSLFLDTELPPTIAGFTLSSLVVAAGFTFLLWAPLVYGYENFDVRFLPYFADTY